MNYKETLDFLFTSLPVFQHQGASAYKPGLEQTERLLQALDQPQTKFRTVHIAGTNGKGSTSHMLASVLQKAGYRTGLYTSPHLYDFRERIKINGEMIPEQDVVDFVEQHTDIIDGLSFFEMTVGMAFDYFAREGVDVAVIETGLGGRLDSTNVITPLVSVITNIGLDHMNLLGDTLPEIACEKAGIIKSGVPVVIGESDELTAPVFSARAEQIGSRITFAEDAYRCVEALQTGRYQRFCIERRGDGAMSEFDLDLRGDYQRKNLVTALAAIDCLGALNIPESAVVEGLRDAAALTGLHGRWEVVCDAPLTVFDTGHNAHGLRLVVDQIARQKFKRLYFVLGVVADKDLGSILPLLPTEAYYIFTKASVARALSAEELRDAAKSYGLEGEIVDRADAAYGRARDLASNEDMIFIGGSTFTVSSASRHTELDLTVFQVVEASEIPTKRK